METLRSVARLLGILVTMTFVLAVSETFADEINGDRHEGSLMQPEAVGTPWNSGRFAEDFNSGRHDFADFNSDVSFDQDEIHGRTEGIRDGYWLRLYLDDHDEKWVLPSDSSTAVPEPGTFLLLANGVGFLLFALRRAMKA